MLCCADLTSQSLAVCHAAVSAFSCCAGCARSACSLTPRPWCQSCLNPGTCSPSPTPSACATAGTRGECAAYRHTQVMCMYVFVSGHGCTPVLSKTLGVTPQVPLHQASTAPTQHVCCVHKQTSTTHFRLPLCCISVDVHHSQPNRWSVAGVRQ